MTIRPLFFLAPPRKIFFSSLRVTDVRLRLMDRSLCCFRCMYTFTRVAASPTRYTPLYGWELSPDIWTQYKSLHTSVPTPESVSICLAVCLPICLSISNCIHTRTYAFYLAGALVDRRIPRDTQRHKNKLCTWSCTSTAGPVSPRGFSLSCLVHIAVLSFLLAKFQHAQRTLQPPQRASDRYTRPAVPYLHPLCV